MIRGETPLQTSTKASSGIHHHQQVLVLLLPLLGLHGLHVGEEGGDAVCDHGEHSDPVAPAGIVVVWVEEPLPVPAPTSEHGQAEEDQTGDDSLQHKVEQDQVELEPEHVLHGPSEVERHVHDESDVHEEEGEGGEELYEHEPPGCHPLPDLTVLVAPDGVAAVVHPVVLVTREPELVEAECPESHVEEPLVRPGVLPAGQPVGRGEGDEPEDGRPEGSDACVEKSDGRPLGRLLLLVEAVVGVGAGRHDDGVGVCVYQPNMAVTGSYR